MSLSNGSARPPWESGKTRNALIREAVGEWLGRHRPAKWPAEVTNFRVVDEKSRLDLSISFAALVIPQ